jgi:hypothetical protein
MNALEEHALALLKRDSLAEAEKKLGVGPQSVALGMMLLQDVQQQKADVFSVLDDTHFSIHYDEFAELLERRRFEKIYTETHGDRRDVYEIWWHSDGVLLTSESYDRKRVNMTQVYYNWMPASREAPYEIRSSGGYVAPGVWAGHFDGREGLFTHLKKLRKTGHILQSWVEAPFLWLLNYSDTKDKNYDYKAISRLKFCVLPEHVQKAIGPILV